jgi:hypothetical protein
VNDVELKKLVDNKQCPLCRKQFEEFGSLRKHLEDHYDCPICYEKLDNSRQLVLHMRKHLRSLESDFPVSFYSEKLICFVCSKKFTNVELCRQHLRNHNQDLRAIGRILLSLRKKKRKKEMTDKDWLRWEQQIQDLKNIHKAG